MLTRETYLKGVVKVDFNEFRNFIEKVSEAVKDIGKRDMFDEPLIYFSSCDNADLLKVKIYDKEDLAEIGSVPVLKSETAVDGEYRDISISDIQNIHRFMDKFIADDGSVCILDGTVYLFFSIRKMIINVDDECLVIY